MIFVQADQGSCDIKFKFPFGKASFQDCDIYSMCHFVKSHHVIYIPLGSSKHVNKMIQ